MVVKIENIIAHKTINDQVHIPLNNRNYSGEIARFTQSTLKI